jgi:type 1 glutamine amidotransferase
MRVALLLAASAVAWSAGPPVRVLVVTGGHSYQPSFYTLFEGHSDIEATVDPHPMPYRRGDLRPRYDVLVLYDSVQEISADERKTLQDFLESGKGLVLLHHALVDYSDWPWWYEEVVGGRWLKQPGSTRWKTTWKHDVVQKVYSVADHPITRGIHRIDILDETYKGMWLSPRIKVLLRTDEETSDGPVAWIGPYEKSRVVVIQLGHGREAHLHPDYQRLVRNAILWSAGR